MAKYIKNAFAVNGDRQPVPDDTQPSGQVSYQSGYTPDYALPKTDPNRKSIGRQPWNQLFNDVTANIKEWQDYGYPEFVSDDGTGSVKSYSYGRVVHLSGELYRALVDGTATTPPSAEWEAYDPAHDVNAPLSYAVSQLANGNSSKVGLLINGTVVDTLDYVVYPPELTIWATNGATGTSDGTLNTGTGAAGGVTGTLTLTQYDKYDNSVSGLTATTQQAAIDESYAATLALSGKVIATGSATFTNSNNNIFLPGIGLDNEVGDVVRPVGSVNNDKAFTIEFITDDDNVIVNAAHAGGTTSKSLVDETATVTVKLLSKWFNAPLGLGQGWVGVSRTAAQNYTAPQNRTIKFSTYIQAGAGNAVITINGQQAYVTGSNFIGTMQQTIPPAAEYSFGGTVVTFSSRELR